LFVEIYIYEVLNNFVSLILFVEDPHVSLLAPIRAIRDAHQIKFRI
jgi:hypothetical protein